MAPTTESFVDNEHGTIQNALEAPAAPLKIRWLPSHHRPAVREELWTVRITNARALHRGALEIFTESHGRRVSRFDNEHVMRYLDAIRYNWGSSACTQFWHHYSQYSIRLERNISLIFSGAASNSRMSPGKGFARRSHQLVQ
jgi:hypothetical protein